MQGLGGMAWHREPNALGKGISRSPGSGRRRAAGHRPQAARMSARRKGRRRRRSRTRRDSLARVNDDYLKLGSGYLFSEIARRVQAFQAAHPQAKLIRLGIGDVTQPLPAAVITGLHAAVDEMARAETFRGYGPETGYEFLTTEIAKHDYGARGVSLALDEIFVSDGAKSDTANIQEIFAPDCVVALTDPVYPVD